MRAIVKATSAGTIADLDKRDDLVLVQTDYDVKAIEDYFGKRRAVLGFGGFFVKVEDGEYEEVYGFNGTVPTLTKTIYKITRTYQEDNSPKKKSPKKTRSHKSTSPTGLRGTRH